ncbi:NAD kinase [uncultured Faecalicoccus sp.]|uniref:NAD kinase n=1 Tax=uncultured Faecalicoccus sp. TaxID=1971760 RepID=UPI00260ECCF3|nr:NAD kinase [uncultured Faecalicoccus sp.]
MKMKGKMSMRFTTIVRNDEHSRQVSKHLIQECQNRGWIYDSDNPEMILSIGGDGTLLRGIHQYLPVLDQISFVGIHTGTLGFFTDYTHEEIHSFLEDIVANIPCYEEMPLLQMETSLQKETCYALNEIRIESFSKTLSFDVYIDGEFFEHCTGSGICISTQAGSTAINRALQGAVIDDGLRVLQLCEIMAISHKNHHSLRNPYIMRSDREVKIQGQSLAMARACYDHLETSLQDVEWVKIKTSKKRVRFAHYREYSYLKRLKNLY